MAAFSAGVVPRQVSGASRPAKVRHCLAAGALEPGFGRFTREWTERPPRARVPGGHEDWIGGHDQVWR